MKIERYFFKNDLDIQQVLEFKNTIPKNRPDQTGQNMHNPISVLEKGN